MVLRQRNSREAVKTIDRPARSGLLGVFPPHADQMPEARRLAEALGVPLFDEAVNLKRLDAGALVVAYQDEIPSLLMTGAKSPGPVTVDFASKALAHRRQAGHNELLGRAVGWSADASLQILDATAGFGRDAFVLADLNCHMHLCERNPPMAELLTLAIARARESEDPWLQQVASRLHLVGRDARELDPAFFCEQSVDAIYLDPMFPPERKALPAKEMQVLHRLLSFDLDSQSDEQAFYQGQAKEMLEWALDQKVRRVVVKRPRREKPLSGRPPGHSVEGRSTRFDVYPLNKS